jgi:hypothetical protein
MNGGAAGQYLLEGYTTSVDPRWGNDSPSTGGRLGVLNNPFKTLQAMRDTVLSAGWTFGKCWLSPGIFDVGANQYIFPDNLEMQGAGRYATILKSSLSAQTFGNQLACFVPGNNSSLRDLQIDCTNADNNFRYPIGTGPQDTQVFNSEWHNLWIKGNSDNIYFAGPGGSVVRARGCTFNSDWDTAYGQSPFTFIGWDCEFNAKGPNTIIDGNALANAFNLESQNGSIVELYNCRLNVYNPAGNANGFWVADGPGNICRILMSGGSFNVQAPGHQATDVNGGTILPYSWFKSRGVVYSRPLNQLAAQINQEETILAESLAITTVGGVSSVQPTYSGGKQSKTVAPTAAQTLGSNTLVVNAPQCIVTPTDGSEIDFTIPNSSTTTTETLSFSNSVGSNALYVLNFTGISVPTFTLTLDGGQISNPISYSADVPTLLNNINQELIGSFYGGAVATGGAINNIGLTFSGNGYSLRTVAAPVVTVSSGTTPSVTQSRAGASPGYNFGVVSVPTIPSGPNGQTLNITFKYSSSTFRFELKNLQVH